MNDERDDQQAGAGETPPDGHAATRRRLMMGAAAASAIVTIRPALAETAGSIMTCQIPIPDPKYGSGKWIDKAGRMVDAGTPDSYRGPRKPLTAEQVKAVMNGGSYPGASPEASQAYREYIRKLRNGMSGFTCYQSLQMPRP